MGLEPYNGLLNEPSGFFLYHVPKNVTSVVFYLHLSYNARVVYVLGKYQENKTFYFIEFDEHLKQNKTNNQVGTKVLTCLLSKPSIKTAKNMDINKKTTILTHTIIPIFFFFFLSLLLLVSPTLITFEDQQVE